MENKIIDLIVEMVRENHPWAAHVIYPREGSRFYKIGVDLYSGDKIEFDIVISDENVDKIKILGDKFTDFEQA